MKAYLMLWSYQSFLCSSKSRFLKWRHMAPLCVFFPSVKLLEMSKSNNINTDAFTVNILDGITFSMPFNVLKMFCFCFIGLN